MSTNVITTEHREIAAKLMSAIMYDNGCVNVFEPEKYSLEYVERIALCVAEALEANENLEFDEEVIECMASGEQSEMQALIDNYETFESLNKALSDYFNQL